MKDISTWSFNYAVEDYSWHFRWLLALEIVCMFQDLLHKTGQYGYQHQYCYPCPTARIASYRACHHKNFVALSFRCPLFWQHCKEGHFLHSKSILPKMLYKRKWGQQGLASHPKPTAVRVVEPRGCTHRPAELFGACRQHSPVLRSQVWVPQPQTEISIWKPATCTEFGVTRSSQHGLPHACVCAISFCSHMVVVTVLPSHVPLYLRRQPEESGLAGPPCTLHMTNALPGLCSPDRERMEEHTRRWLGLSQDSPSMPLGCIKQEPAVYIHYIPMYLLSSPTSQFDLCMLISICKAHFSGRFRHAVQNCLAVSDSLERGVWAAGVFCTFSPEERIGFPWEGRSSYPLSSRRDSHRQAHNPWQYTILQGFLRDTPCSLAILK